MPRYGYTENTESPITYLERASDIKLQGMMAHSKWLLRVQNWDYQGFKRWHEMNYKCDSKAYNKINKFLVDHFRYEVPDKDIKPIYEMSDNLKDHLLKWISFEETVIKELSGITIWLFNNGYIKASCKVGKMVKEAEEERKRVRRVYDELEKCQFNEMQIFAVSERHHNFRKEHKERIYP